MVQKHVQNPGGPRGLPRRPDARFTSTCSGPPLNSGLVSYVVLALGSAPLFSRNRTQCVCPP